MKIATLIAGVALSAACFMMPQAVNAVPALPTPVTMTMPDGSVITVRVHGDEKFITTPLPTIMCLWQMKRDFCVTLPKTVRH